MANISALIPAVGLAAARSAAMRQLLFAAAVVAVSPRGSPPAAAQDSTGPSPVPNIAGHWIIGSTSSIPSLAAVCEVTDTADIVQSGSSFSGSVSGTVTCGASGRSVTGPTSATISDGRISGNQVTFTTDTRSCLYEGTFSGNPPNRMSGTAACLGPRGRHDGTWLAVRR